MTDATSMAPDPALDLDEIDLSDPIFWARPWAEREGAFALLRAEAPIRFFEEREGDPEPLTGPEIEDLRGKLN